MSTLIKILSVIGGIGVIAAVVLGLLYWFLSGIDFSK